MEVIRRSPGKGNEARDPLTPWDRFIEGQYLQALGAGIEAK
jgi:hypothetical protein